jgi:hypothetical protein
VSSRAIPCATTQSNCNRFREALQDPPPAKVTRRAKKKKEKDEPKGALLVSASVPDLSAVTANGAAVRTDYVQATSHSMLPAIVRFNPEPAQEPEQEPAKRADPEHYEGADGEIGLSNSTREFLGGVTLCPAAKKNGRDLLQHLLRTRERPTRGMGERRQADQLLQSFLDTSLANLSDVQGLPVQDLGGGGGTQSGLVVEEVFQEVLTQLSSDRRQVVATVASHFRDLMTSLPHQLIERERTIDDMVSNEHRLQQQNAALEAALGTARAEAVAHERERACLSESLFLARQRCGDLEAAVDAAVDTELEAQAAADVSASRLRTLAREMEALCTRTDEERTAAQRAELALRQQLHLSQEQCLHLQGLCHGQEEAVVELHAVRAELELETQESQRRADELRVRASELMGMVAELREQKERADAAEDRIVAVEKMYAERSSVRTLKDKFEQRIKALQAEAINSTSERDKIKGQFEDMQVTIDRLHKEIAKHQKNWLEQEGVLSGERDQCRKLREQLDALAEKGQVGAAAAEANGFAKAEAEFKKQKLAMLEDLQKLEGQKEAVATAMAGAKAQAGKMRKGLQMVAAKAAEISRMQKETKKLAAAEVKRMKADISSTNFDISARVKRTGDDIKQLQAEQAPLREQMEAAVVRDKATQAKAHCLQEELDQVKERKAELERLLEKERRAAKKAAERAAQELEESKHAVGHAASVTVAAAKAEEKANAVIDQQAQFQQQATVKKVRVAADGTSALVEIALRSVLAAPAVAAHHTRPWPLPPWLPCAPPVAAARASASIPPSPRLLCLLPLTAERAAGHSEGGARRPAAGGDRRGRRRRRQRPAGARSAALADPCLRHCAGAGASAGGSLPILCWKRRAGSLFTGSVSTAAGASRCQ